MIYNVASPQFQAFLSKACSGPKGPKGMVGGVRAKDNVKMEGGKPGAYEC